MINVINFVYSCCFQEATAKLSAFVSRCVFDICEGVGLRPEAEDLVWFASFNQIKTQDVMTKAC